MPSQLSPAVGLNALAFAPALFAGLFIFISFFAGGNGKCVVARDGHTQNESSPKPLELKSCVNFHCPDNYECNNAYKCCLSILSDKKHTEKSSISNALGQP
ncbi:hypothetical protein niasHS_008540 [Heterodera schachtii]|uniref:WAP domain-containing protein n=1 Tax=Heterodera schachtii TaxID=97005 RepID=A0ABD2JEM7_HETSC